MDLSPRDLEVYAYLKNLVDTKACKSSSEAEKMLRTKFWHVSMMNSYTYVQRYFRYREKIESQLAVYKADPENVTACETQVCSSCEA